MSKKGAKHTWPGLQSSTTVVTTQVHEDKSSNYHYSYYYYHHVAVSPRYICQLRKTEHISIQVSNSVLEEFPQAEYCPELMGTLPPFHKN